MPATWEILVAGLLIAQSTAIPQPEPLPNLKLYDHVGFHQVPLGSAGFCSAGFR
jgi:hypothetical protein